jgi:hypothetical protein
MTPDTGFPAASFAVTVMVEVTVPLDAAMLVGAATTVVWLALTVLLDVT